MSSTPADKLAAALDDTRVKPGGIPNKITTLFGDRPEVLDAMRRARARGVSYRTIANVLSAELPAGQSIAEGSVFHWLSRNPGDDG